MPYNRFARRKKAPTAPHGDDSSVSSKPRSKNKFGNEKVAHEDGVFDSRGELERWLQLKEDQEQGKITDLKKQQWIDLVPRQTRWDGKVIPGVRTRVDFTFREHGKLVIEDYKGFETPDFKIKYKLFLLRYPGTEFRLFRRGKPYDPYGPKRKRKKKDLLDT